MSLPVSERSAVGFGPVVLEADGLVEHQGTGPAVAGIQVEIAFPLELVVARETGLAKADLPLAAADHPEGIGVDVGQEIAAAGPREGCGEEPVVEPHLAVDAVAGGHPVDHPPWADALRRVLPHGAGHDAGVDLED